MSKGRLNPRAFEYKRTLLETWTANMNQSYLPLNLNLRNNKPKISNYIHDKVWNEITYTFSNFNGAAVEVWEWISNFFPQFTAHVISYPCWNQKLTPSSKRGPCWEESVDHPLHACAATTYWSQRPTVCDSQEDVWNSFNLLLNSTHNTHHPLSRCSCVVLPPHNFIILFFRRTKQKKNEKKSICWPDE